MCSPTSAEYEPYDHPRPVTITPANAAALNLPASDLGSSPFKQRFQTFPGRADYQINDHNSVYLRYNSYWDPSKYNTSGGLEVTSADPDLTRPLTDGICKTVLRCLPATVSEKGSG